VADMMAQYLQTRDLTFKTELSTRCIAWDSTQYFVCG